MVLDPRKVVKGKTETQSFSRFINGEITDWRPIPSDLSVEDVENEYLDFWLSYGTPTFIHFGLETFERAVRGDRNSTGSWALFEIIKPAVAAAVKDHPSLLQTS
jgi:hypothetical protein